MAAPNPVLLSHVSVGTNNFAGALAFYDAVLATLGARRIAAFPAAASYGRLFPEFWVQTPADGGKAQAANGVHFGFFAPSRAAVQAFWECALAHGALPDGEPAPRPLYSGNYFGCFVRDLDGHKIEAAYWGPEMAEGGE